MKSAKSWEMTRKERQIEVACVTPDETNTTAQICNLHASQLRAQTPQSTGAAAAPRNTWSGRMEDRGERACGDECRGCDMCSHVTACHLAAQHVVLVVGNMLADGGVPFGRFGGLHDAGLQSAERMVLITL